MKYIKYNMLKMIGTKIDSVNHDKIVRYINEQRLIDSNYSMSEFLREAIIIFLDFENFE